jgi:hypothetical protein
MPCISDVCNRSGLCTCHPLHPNVKSTALVGICHFVYSHLRFQLSHAACANVRPLNHVVISSCSFDACTSAGAGANGMLALGVDGVAGAGQGAEVAGAPGQERQSAAQVSWASLL